MNHPHVPTLLLGVLLLGSPRPAGAGTEDLPPLQGPVEMPLDDGRAVVPPGAGPLHGALRVPSQEAAPARTSRPSDRPEEAMSDDPVPGGRSDWRTQGPPDDRPAESIGLAPGPDYFYVPGEYVPDGEDLVWATGFWAKAQPGWEWVPAHWVRRSDGWAFRGGRWEPVSTGRGAPARDAALASELPDAIPLNDGDFDAITRRTVSRSAADVTRFPSGEIPGDRRVNPGPLRRPSDEVDPSDPRLPPVRYGAGGNSRPVPYVRGVDAGDHPDPPVVGYDPRAVPPWRGGFPPSDPLLGPPYPLGVPFPGDVPSYVEIYRVGRRGPIDRAGSLVRGILGGRR
jgi:hypothetical protein